MDDRIHQPAIRQAARALIIDSSERLLLFRADVPGRAGWWFAPGGALEGAETHNAALVREVREETGVEVDMAELRGPVWTRDVPFTWNGAVERHVEQFFLIRLGARRTDIAVPQHRWWALDEILHSSEPFAPARLGEYLAPLLQGTLPRHPLEVGA